MSEFCQQHYPRWRGVAATQQRRVVHSFNRHQDPSILSQGIISKVPRSTVFTIPRRDHFSSAIRRSHAFVSFRSARSGGSYSQTTSYTSSSQSSQDCAVERWWNDIERGQRKDTERGRLLGSVTCIFLSLSSILFCIFWVQLLGLSTSRVRFQRNEKA